MSGRGRPAHVVTAVEAAYAVDRSETEWLEELAAAVAPDLAQGFGTLAYSYDASQLPIRLGAMGGASVVTAEVLARSVATAEEGYVAESWRVLAFGTASQVSGFDELRAMREIFNPLGIHDMLAINAFDPSGLGVWVGAPLPRVTRVSAADTRTWSRVAAHIATAFRLRRRGAAARSPDQAAAVLSTSGRVEHATGDAESTTARAALRESVTRMEHARGARRRRDPDGAVDEWRALVDARWSLLDHFERGGKRYVVAVQNEPTALGPEALTPRQRQLLAAAALGHSNKLIAYEMGLSDSTVRVQLARAAKTLGVTTRRELIALQLAHARAARSQ